jgi:hypothetical protein
MECNMKKPPDKADIVEQIVTALGPLRKDRSKAQACAAIERMIEKLREGPMPPKPKIGEELGEDRNWYFRCGPHAASVRKAAKKLLKALAPYSGGLPVNLKDPLRGLRKGDDQCTIPLQVYRSGLDWLAGHTEADVPPPSTKHLAAEFAHRLVNDFSQKRPSTTFDGQVSKIGTFLYQAVSGEEDVELKRATDTVCKSARENTCIIVRGGFKGNEPLQATIDGQTIFREPGEDELGFMHRAIEAARAARALPVIISEGPL